MIHHHINSDSEIRNQCLYCGNHVHDKKWESVFRGPRHYKTHKCVCGHQLEIVVDFWGSGHDSWDGTLSWRDKTIKKKSNEIKIRTLENKVKLMQAIKK